MQVTIAVLLYNAAPYLQKLTESIDKQSVAIDTRLAVYTRSNDDSLSRIEQFFDKVIQIEPNNFDHGGTRQLAVSQCDSDIIIFLTQDVILTATAIEQIVRSFKDPTVGCAYGRQLPHQNASVFASFLRSFNYPNLSVLRSIEDASCMGIKTCFNSNSFSAYKTQALKEAGGFPSSNIVGEDAIAAVRLLNDNWKIAYNAEACVYHSHDYSIGQEFKRYFDTGVFHQDNAQILLPFQSSNKEGSKFVLSEFKFLLSSNKWWLCPLSIIRNIVKLFGYHFGKRSRFLPNWLNKHLSGHPRFWSN